MKIQIIFKSGREMLLDNVERFDGSNKGLYIITHIDGQMSYINDEVKYIGQPEYKPENGLITIEAIPVKRRLFKL